jgi:N utilization substance protein B
MRPCVHWSSPTFCVASNPDPVAIMTSRKPGRGSRARSVARKLAMQGLYQWQLTGQAPDAGVELVRQFTDSEDYGSADAEYFADLLQQCIARQAELDAVLSQYADRPLAQLDPVERAILWIGIYELLIRLDVPHRVVINEAVELSRRFGATDGHKYINALLDKAARERRAEASAAKS